VNENAKLSNEVAKHSIGGGIGFKVTNFFSMGSPLAAFLIMRGVDPAHIIPSKERVEHYYNVFHPYDPFAYRIEPLFHEVSHLLQLLLG